MLSLQIGTKKITTERPSFVMGICNATSDSFYKKSRGGIKKAFELIEQGADIIDIGAESTRPGFFSNRFYNRNDFFYLLFARNF